MALTGNKLNLPFGGKRKEKEMNKIEVAKLAKVFKETYNRPNVKQTAFKGAPTIRVAEDVCRIYTGFWAIHTNGANGVVECEPKTNIEAEFNARLEKSVAEADEFAAAHGGKVLVIKSDTTEPTYDNKAWDKIYNSPYGFVGGMAGVKRVMARLFKPNGNCREIKVCVRIAF